MIWSYRAGSSYYTRISKYQHQNPKSHETSAIIWLHWHEDGNDPGNILAITGYKGGNVFIRFSTSKNL